MDLVAGLNTPQRAAVTHDKGPLLIFAGAGSGKTRTLTHRIAYLIRERGVPPGRILAVTFTNKAAREMRERLANLAGTDANRLWMGTFHSLCAQMLRIHGSRIGLDPRFVIFDSDDSLRLMKEILREADIDSERYPPSRVLNRISDAKNNLRSPEAVAGVAVQPNDRVLARLYQRYQERLRVAHALDFDDLLSEAVRLLSQDPESGDYWSERFLHVLIDEFQDVNAAQFKWAQLLARKHRNICVVGDDDQSIYAWRGANVRLILDFEASYPDAAVIHLEQNYRSTQNILDAAHGVISRNLGRRAKRLWTDLNGGAGVTLHGSANAQEEALWVVRKIQELQRERHGPLADFAILCRVNAQSRPFEEAFLRARLPLKLVGTQRFYERKEIKDLLAYLRVLYNPNDSVALNRIINVPARGIGAVTIQKMEALARDHDRSLYEVILDETALSEIGRAAAQKIVPLRYLLQRLQEDLKAIGSMSEMLDRVLEATQYYEFLRRERTVEGIDRIANVQEFLTAAALFDERMSEEDAGSNAGDDDMNPRDGAPHLGLFLESTALDSDSNAAGGTDDAVTLMTLHSAKGLEFPIVFMVGLEQGLLPHSRALWGEGSNAEELEEERRLCYVGLTRAREQVFLTYAAQRTLHGRTESTQPSQFLEEIPPHLMQRLGFAASRSNASYRAATEWSSPASAASSAPSSVRPSTPARAASPLRFNVGDRLKHPSFGEGMVVAASPGGGAGEWVEVAFFRGDVGKKKLIVAYAPLEKV